MIVDNITQGAGAHPLHRSYLDSKKKIESEHKTTGPANSMVSSDKIEISEDAKLLMQQNSIVQTAKEALNALPDVRSDKVEQSEERLQSGFYEKPEVYSRVADTLVANPNEEPVAETLNVSGEKLEVRLEKIQQAQQKIEDGFYERQEILENIISRLLEY